LFGGFLPRDVTAGGKTNVYKKEIRGGGGGDKACRCVGLTSLQLSCADCTEILSHSSS